jgi:hypothetical protein
LDDRQLQQQQQPTDKQTNVKASLLPRELVRRRCEELDRRDSEKLDNSCSLSLSPSHLRVKSKNRRILFLELLLQLLLEVFICLAKN